MADRRLHRVAAAEVFADRLRLGRGLDNDECAALCRSGVGFFSIRRRESLIRDFFLSRRSLLFWFHFLFIIRHLSTSVQNAGRLAVRIFTIPRPSAQALRPHRPLFPHSWLQSARSRRPWRRTDRAPRTAPSCGPEDHHPSKRAGFPKARRGPRSLPRAPSDK